MESGDYMKRSDLRIYLTYSHIYLRKVKTDCFSEATILITINLFILLVNITLIISRMTTQIVQEKKLIVIEKTQT